MQTRTIAYQDGDQTCQGYFAFDETRGENQPTVLVFHAFEGLDDFTKSYAADLVKAGFAVFCVDMYGDGKVSKDFDTCVGYFKTFFGDRLLTQQRALAGLEAACAQAQVDADKIAAMGFCFGGMCALDLARAGADIKGVAALHSLLSAPEGIELGTFKAKALILHGFEDPQVTPDQLHVIADELNAQNVDWQFVFFSHTKHAYTDPEAAKLGPAEMGREYNADSARRAFRYACDFFNETL